MSLSLSIEPISVKYWNVGFFLGGGGGGGVLMGRGDLGFRLLAMMLIVWTLLLQ